MNAKKRFMKRFRTLAKDLRLNPYLYQYFDKELDGKIRRVVIQKYIIFYQINIKDITILRILPEKFDYFNYLEKYKILIQK